jgi:hypothetical protein
MFTKILAAIATSAVLATSALAQDGSITSALLPIQNEAPAKLFVDAPLPGPLARGAVLIPYRVENFRIVPVLGADALKISPRVGHLHVTLDDLPWRWGDFSNVNTIVVNGLPPGPHKILIELSDPTHRILAAQAVHFTVPGAAPGAAPHAH